MKQIFPYGRPVTGRDLIDRKDVIERIMNDVMGGQSIILTAPRRYGKTSVIHECLRRLGSRGILTGYVDLFEKTSVRELAEGIVETTLRNETSNAAKIIRAIKTNLPDFLRMVQFRHIWQEHEFILSFGSGKANEDALLNQSLDFPEKYARSKGKELVFAMDEFGDLKNWDGRLMKKLRAKFQRQKNVTYIFSGSQESVMKDLFTNKAFAFYGFGKIVEMGPLPPEDLREYLSVKLKKAGFKMGREVLRHLCQLSGNHPHYTKIVAQATLEQLERRRAITMKDVDEGFNRAFFQVKGELDREWGSLSRAPLQRRVLKFLAHEHKGVYARGSLPGADRAQIYFALTELENKGIILKVARGKFMFANPFFKEYISGLNKYM